jgi:D-threo-aldose 1-dehydrogenase
MYGFGLAERRFGHFLHNKTREDYLLSSKVGKLFKASKNNQHAEIYPLSDSPNDIVFDYTADGVRRSIEDNNTAFSRHSLGTMLLCTGCR